MSEVDNSSRGIVKDRNRLYWEDFKQICSLYPPKDEQTRIADAIDAISIIIDRAVARITQDIALLHEYRTRLTADVVTGKLDVREAATNLPVEADESEVAEEPEVVVEGEELAAEGELDPEELIEAA